MSFFITFAPEQETKTGHETAVFPYVLEGTRINRKDMGKKGENREDCMSMSSKIYMNGSLNLIRPRAPPKTI